MDISVIIPVRNDPKALERCLDAIHASGYSRMECIVVDDGSTDVTPAVAARYPVRLIRLADGPRGPAYARNRGAEVATGDVLFFVDADVIVRPDTLHRMAETFERADVAAVFGSYDDAPASGNFLSRYKNLFHHFVHQQAARDALTFWSGCGAVRRAAFVEVGGFDEERYRRPSIEDVDLGYRLKARGYQIRLNADIQVKHLKRWTLREMIKSDILDRGIPWTRLILEAGTVPNTLNLHISQRASAMLLLLALLYLGLTAVFHYVVILPLLIGLFVVVAGNWSEDRPHFQMSPRARRIAHALIATIAGLAIGTGEIRILVPVGLVVLGLGVDQWVLRSTVWMRRLLFTALVLGLAAGAGLLIASFSLRLVAPPLLVLLLIMAVNYRLYLFFARREGIMFAMAVVPFHLLYYLYSVAAFTLGTMSFLLDGLSGRAGTRLRRAHGRPRSFLRTAPAVLPGPLDEAAAHPE